MRIDILTIFPRMFDAVLNESMLKRAQKRGILKIIVHNIRDYTLDKHRKVDDRPFGGGPGMVMRPEPIFRAMEYIASKVKISKQKVILLSPQGKSLNQNLARRLSKYQHLVLICGHYEGIDERVKKRFVDLEVSIGDYILTGGELPAMVLVDAVARLIPGVLGRKDSLTDETFQDNLLEYPQYTRPAVYRKMKVPAILLSGNHKKIKEWRTATALKITRQKRPELLAARKAH
jgi:tRNA (guanine37-N1)-methyltransferase